MPTYNIDPVMNTALQWRQRSAHLRAGGVPDSAWQPVAKADIQRVQQGQSAYTREEVQAAILTNIQGQPVVKPQQQGTSPADVIGNIPSDVSGIIKGLPKGIEHLFDPRTYINSYKTLAHNATTPGIGLFGEKKTGNFGQELASGLRGAAALPASALIPGLHTAAGLTTSEGRKGLERHPVGTLLDVIPAAHHLSEALGGFTATARGVNLPEAAAATATTAEVTGKAARAGRGKALAQAAQEGTIGPATLALARGNPIRAGVAATGELLDKVPGLRTFGRENIVSTARNLGMSAEFEPILRGYAVGKRGAVGELKKFFNEEMSPYIKGMTPDQIKEATYYAQHYGEPGVTIPPEYDALLTHVRSLNDRLAEMGMRDKSLQRVPVPGASATAIYEYSQPVARAYRTYTRIADTMTSAWNKYNWAKMRLQQATERMASNVGKVRQFGESEADFAAREAGVISVSEVTKAVQPLAETFIHLDARHVFQEYGIGIMDGRIGVQAARRLGEDFTRLSGENGLFAKFNEALAQEDIKAARSHAASIDRIFRHQSWQNFETTKTLRTFMSETRDELIGLSGRSAKHGAAARALGEAQRRMGDAESSLRARQERLRTASDTFHTELFSTPPAAFQPAIVDSIRSGMVEQARILHLGTQVEDVLLNSPRVADFKRILGDDTFNAISQDAVSSWVDLAKQGMDPLWMHHVPLNRLDSIMSPTPLPDRFIDPGMWEAKGLNFSPGVQDIAVGITAAARELIQSRATEEFIHTYITPQVKTTEELYQHYSNLDVKTIDPRIPRSSLIEEQVQKDWVRWNPEKYGVGGQFRVSGGEAMFIPKGLGRSLDMMMKDYRLPIRGGYDRLMNVYKFAVLTGPRHIAHVAFGGLAFMMIREPLALLQATRAFRMFKEGVIPDELRSNLYESPDKVFQYAAGKTAGRLLQEALPNVHPAQLLAKFEEHISTIYKTMTMLQGEASGLTREAAIREAYKVFVDMDGMSAMERTVVRNIFPFYGFTRHLFRYLFTLPVDHPYRAAILSKFAEQEVADQKSGLPQKYLMMFFLGKPDKNGNVTAIDFKSLNPFRSIAGDFSLAGFLSSLNPLITAPFEAAGVNVLTGSTDLYPQLHYDPATGSLVSKPKNAIPNILQSFVPEVGAVDHFIQFSDQLRKSKQSNPEAYRRQLFSALNIPFSAAKSNVPMDVDKAEFNVLRVEEQDKSAALKTGNFESLRRYNSVRVGSEFVDPRQLEAYWGQVRDSLTRTSGHVPSSAEVGAVVDRLVRRRGFRLPALTQPAR